MQDTSLLFLGSIFTVGALIVYIYGRNKDNNNALLWSLFPLFHGLHEFVDYFSDGNLLLMRTEVFLAIISSLVLLAVSIEFLGQEHSLYGKLTSLLLLILFSYFLFVIPDDVFTELYNLVFMFGIINTDFFKSMYGILLIVISLIALIYNLIIIKSQNEKAGISTKHYNQIIIATVVTMILFIFFEGFSLDLSQPDITKQLFSLMEAFFGSLFVIFPLVFMAISKPGLNSLIAFNPEDGRFIFAYD